MTRPEPMILAIDPGTTISAGRGAAVGAVALVAMSADEIVPIFSSVLPRHGLVQRAARATFAEADRGKTR